MPSRPLALARPEFFHRMGRFETLRFAEMPAGAGTTHLVLLDLERQTLHCSCPLRPKPCLHALALVQLHGLAGDGIFQPVESVPEDVALLQTGHGPRWRPGPAEPVREAARQQRRFERLERATRGMEELEAWLSDTLRRGLATVASEDPEAFANIAARLADASLTGLSRLFRRLHETVVSPQPPSLAWEEVVLDSLADCYLAVRAFRNRQQLSDELLFDLQAFLGISVKKEEVWAQGETLSDVWAVLGQAEEAVEDKLRVRRTWLFGGRSQRAALLQEYGFGEAGNFAPGLAPGTVVQARLAFYPSAAPLRALVGDDVRILPKKVEKMPGYPGFEAFAAAFAGALGEQPWLSIFPAAFPAVIPVMEAGKFFLIDGHGVSLPLAMPEMPGWKIMALSGGHPVGLFGEWEGERLRPLSVVAEGRLVRL